MSLLIVVADDMPESRDELARAVGALGHRVLTAAGGAEALLLAESRSPDLVLLDLLMPDLTGFEVASMLAQRVTNRWLPVIVMSSMAGEDHFVEALSRGADDYIVRPVNLPLLEAKLTHYRKVLSLQASAQAAATRLRAMHRAIPDALITVDASGQVVETNPAADALMGDVCGHPLPQPLQPGTESALLTLKGSVRFAITAGEWATDHGRFTTYVLHDLTERLRVERMKDEFLATVSHELRTPLTSVVGALDLITAGAAGELPEDAAKLAGVAHENGQRLGRLIDDILEVTRLEARGPSLELRTQALEPILRAAVRAHGSYASRAAVTLQLQCDLADAQAAVDAERLMQVISNLLSNAVKHSPRGECVLLQLADGGDAWVISVVDRGPGIPLEFRPRLFERFAQADSGDRRAVAGTGLGLYITRVLVHGMRGTIDAVSEPGKGAAFEVRLPKARGPGDD